MQINLNITNEVKDITVEITAPEKSQEVENILKVLSDSQIKTIIGIKEGATYIVKLDSVIAFYTGDKKVYFKTIEGEFEISNRMYEIEESIIDENFIRISNSVIVNINHVKCFDTAQIGNIIVRFDDESFEYVSKRKISTIMKFLKERRRLK